MEHILINNRRLYLNTRIQKGTTGREFEMSRTEQVLNESPQWVGKELLHWWIHRFTYLDDRSEYFEIKISPKGDLRYYRTHLTNSWKCV